MNQTVTKAKGNIQVVRKILVFVGLSVLTFSAFASVPVPDGFRLQKLEETDGEIAVPKGWYFRTGSTSSGIVWTISKENPDKGGYEIGQRIQLLIGVEQGTKKPKIEFVEKFIESKRKISRIIKDCKPEEQGKFYRQCLEVVEPPSKNGVKKEFHVLYTFFGLKTWIWSL